MAAKFVRVKDLETGHEYDVREDSHLIRKELVKVVKPKQYPPSRYPRAPKHHINLAEPARAEQSAPASAEVNPEEKELEDV